MLKRRAFATGTVVFGFLVAASCGDSSDTGDGGGGKGSSGDAGESGDGGTSGSSGTGGRGGSSGSGPTGGTSGTGTSGAAGEPGGGGEPSGGTGGNAGAGEGGEPGGGGEPTTGGTGGGGAGGMAGKAGGGSGGGGGITCPTVANFDEDWSARVCQKNNDCCMSATPSTCVSDAQAGIIQLYPSLETSITAGQAEFNCADYIACMTAVNAASCNDWPKEASPDFGLPVNEPKCRTFIRGLIPSGNGMNGMACTQSYQCINGHCADPDGTGTQVRQCVAFRGTGLSCEAVPAAGEANLVCNPVIGWCDQPDTNVAGVCRARGVNGATCANGDQCESRICSTTCQAAAPAACPWIPQPVTCSVSNVGAQKGSLSWLALAGFIGLGAMGRRRRRR